MSIRLLFLTAETCPTFRADVTALFGKYLPRHGVYTDVVSGRTPGHSGPVVWGGGEAYLFEIAGGQAKKHIKTLLHGIKHLFAADRARYQAIQVRDMPVLAAIGLLAARLKGLPFYYWMSFPMPEDQIERARERGMSAGIMKFLFPWLQGRVGHFLLYRVVLPLSDHVFVQSDRMKQDMEARGVSAQKMTPVPMGVDLEFIQADPIEPSDDPRLARQRVLVYLGTMDRSRRIETLFTVLGLVRQTFPNTLLVLAGDTVDPMHREWLIKQAHEAGQDVHVIWTGWLPAQDGLRYVRAAEVALSYFPRGFLLDSASPTKVVEYLALGVPVVCNDNPDQARVIQESGAGICVPYSAQAFADAVIQLLQQSEAGTQHRSEQGMAYVASCRSYAAISKNVAEAYHRVSRS